jgi:hypothetical protein
MYQSYCFDCGSYTAIDDATNLCASCYGGGNQRARGQNGVIMTTSAAGVLARLQVARALPPAHLT